MELILSSSTLSLPRTLSIGPLYLPKQDTLVVAVATSAVAVVVRFVLHTFVSESNLHASSVRHCFEDSLKHGSGFSAAVAVAAVVLLVVVLELELAVCFVVHTLPLESNLHALSARHCFEDSLKHGSELSLGVVGAGVATDGTEKHPDPINSESASNAQPAARQLFLRSPAHGSKGEHFFMPATRPKTHPSTLLHGARLRPSHTLPPLAALLHVLVALSKMHPSVDLHRLPFRPLHTFSGRGMRVGGVGR